MALHAPRVVVGKELRHGRSRTDFLRRFQPAIDPARVRTLTDFRQIGPLSRLQSLDKCSNLRRFVTGETIALLRQVTTTIDLVIVR